MTRLKQGATGENHEADGEIRVKALICSEARGKRTHCNGLCHKQVMTQSQHIWGRHTTSQTKHLAPQHAGLDTSFPIKLHSFPGDLL